MTNRDVALPFDPTSLVQVSGSTETLIDDRMASSDSPKASRRGNAKKWYDRGHPPPDNVGELGDIITTAIVIKNIPFTAKREQFLAILDLLDIAKPYALNYHYDNGVFRGLAFANYRTPEETEIVVSALNGFDVMGRKLRVEYKRAVPGTERERRWPPKEHEERGLQRNPDEFSRIDHDLPSSNSTTLIDVEAQRKNAPVRRSRQSLDGNPHQQSPGRHPNGTKFEREPDLHSQERDLELLRCLSVEQNDSGRQAASDLVTNNQTLMENDREYSKQASLLEGAGKSPNIPRNQRHYQQKQPIRNNDKLDMEDPHIKQYFEEVKAWKSDQPKSSELIFPPTLSSADRRVLHIISEKLGLFHSSEGEGDLRRLKIMRHRPTDINRKVLQRGPNEVRTGTFRNAKPTGEKRDPKEYANGGSPLKASVRVSYKNADTAPSTFGPIRQPRMPDVTQNFSSRLHMRPPIPTILSALNPAALPFQFSVLDARAQSFTPLAT